MKICESMFASLINRRKGINALYTGQFNPNAICFDVFALFLVTVGSSNHVGHNPYGVKTPLGTYYPYFP